MTGLFVYGTLAPGQPNEHIMTKIGGQWQRGTVTGKLIEEGWGAEMGYPGIVLDKDGGPIQGFVFCSANLEQHWPQLDEFEGCEYQRVLTEVALENGNQVDAYIYQIA